MIRGIQASGNALGPAMLAQDAIANNLANATSTGFRQDRIAFERTFFQGGAANAGGAATVEEAGGLAPRLRTAVDARPGPYDVTERKLDLAIQGEGWFVVETPDGERYTRAGHFQLADDGTVVTSQGYPLLSEGGPVTLTGEEDFAIAPNGEVRVGTESRGRLRVAVFDGDPGLTHVGGGLFAAKGEPAAAADAHVLQGVLEGSNVEPMQALVEMLALTRHFEMNQKAFQAQDDALGTLLSWVRG